MSAVERPGSGLGFCLLLAVLAWAGSTSLAYATGYWACSAGAWVAIGHPEHPLPSRQCGSQLEIPETQLACEQAGGKWGRAGIFPKPICKVPTHDAGRPCADAGECEGECLATLTAAQRDLVMKRQRLQILGKCTAYAPIFGCMAIVEKSFVTGIMCRD